MENTERKRFLKEASLMIFLSLLCIVGLTVMVVFVFLKEKPKQDSEEITTAVQNSQTVTVENPIFSSEAVVLTLSESASTASAEGLYSKQAVLVNGKTGEILAKKDSDTAFSPASMTKVMTLTVLTEHLTEEDLDRQVTQTAEIVEYVKSGNYSGSSVSLVDGDKNVGDTFSVRDLLYGIGVKSAADCCVMLVCEVCPSDSIAESEAMFTDWMNQKAAGLGLTNTHFDNAIGYESAANYTTAKEMAIIAAYAMQCPLIADILSRKEYVGTGHYYKNGEPATYNVYFKNTFFVERMETFKKQKGTAFSLSGGWSVTEAKTGSFGKNSFLVCELRKTGDDTPYYLVLGESEKSTYPASVYTLTDIQTVVRSCLQ